MNYGQIIKRLHNFESHNSLKLSFTNIRDLRSSSVEWEALLHSVSFFFFLYRSPPSSLCKVFDSISSNIDEVLSINQSANVFVFGSINVHHKDSLTYSGGTHRPGELCYNFSISNYLTQMVNFPTQIPDCASPSPAFLDLLLSSDAGICSSVAFTSLGNSDHVVVSFSIDFSSNSKRDARFDLRFIVSLMATLVLIGMVFVIILEMFHGKTSLSTVLLLLLVNFVSGFRLELMYISLIVSIRSSLTHLHGFQLLVLLP